MENRNENFKIPLSQESVNIMSRIRTVQLNKDNIEMYSSSMKEIDEKMVKLHGATYSIEQWDISNFERDLPNKWEYSLVILVEDKLVGFIIVSSTDATSLHINRFAIDSQFQKIGIGKMLINDLLSMAKKGNINMITLIANINNCNAIKFYKNRGYKVLTKNELQTFLAKKNRIDQYRGNYLVDCNNIKYQVYRLYVSAKE